MRGPGSEARRHRDAALVHPHEGRPEPAPNVGLHRLKRVGGTFQRNAHACVVQGGAFLVSMVVTAIYATWTLIIKSAKIGQEAAAQVQRERVAFRTFEDALVCARSFQADLQHYSFIVENGSTPTLSFVARLPEFFPRSGRFGDFDVRRVTFSLENGSDGHQQLVLRQTPILMETDETEQQYPFVLPRNVSKMEFELWDARKGKWVDEWTTTNEIPSMIHLTLTYSRHNPDKPYATPQTEVVSRVVDISSTMVPGGFQRRGQSTGATNAPNTPPGAQRLQ